MVSSERENLLDCSNGQRNLKTFVVVHIHLPCFFHRLFKFINQFIFTLFQISARSECLTLIDIRFISVARFRWRMTREWKTWRLDYILGSCLHPTKLNQFIFILFQEHGMVEISPRSGCLTI